MGFYGFDWPCLNAVLSFSCIPTAGFPDASSRTCRNRIRTKNIKTQDLSYKICLALQDLAVLLNENPLSSPGKLSLPCLSHPWFACFHFFARRKYELTTKSKRFSMIFIFIALSRPVSDKFAVHLARNPRKSVAGVLLCLPPGTEFPRKCSRCPFLPPTWHGIPAKAWQVAPLIAHLPRQFLSSWDVGAFQQDKLVVCSMKRVAVCTPAAAKYMHLSENHDVSRMVQLRVSHIWTHLQLQNDLTDACRAYLSLRVC